MDKLIGKFLGKLDDDLFITTRGVAYQYNMKTVKYNGEYFDKYQNYRGTEIADKLNECRVTLVSKYTTDPILDIGSTVSKNSSMRAKVFPSPAM